MPSARQTHGNPIEECPVKICKPESKGERAESVFSDWAIHVPCCLLINVGGKAYSDGWLLVHSHVNKHGAGCASWS